MCFTTSSSLYATIIFLVSSLTLAKHLPFAFLPTLRNKALQRKARPSDSSVNHVIPWTTTTNTAAMTSLGFSDNSDKSDDENTKNAAAMASLENEAIDDVAEDIKELYKTVAEQDPEWFECFVLEMLDEDEIDDELSALVASAKKAVQKERPLDNEDPGDRGGPIATSLTDESVGSGKEQTSNVGYTDNVLSDPESHQTNTPKELLDLGTPTESSKETAGIGEDAAIPTETPSKNWQPNYGSGTLPGIHVPFETSGIVDEAVKLPTIESSSIDVEVAPITEPIEVKNNSKEICSPVDDPVFDEVATEITSESVLDNPSSVPPKILPDEAKRGPKVEQTIIKKGNTQIPEDSVDADLENISVIKPTTRLDKSETYLETVVSKGNTQNLEDSTEALIMESNPTNNTDTLDAFGKSIDDFFGRMQGTMASMRDIAPPSANVTSAAKISTGLNEQSVSTIVSPTPDNMQSSNLTSTMEVTAVDLGNNTVAFKTTTTAIDDVVIFRDAFTGVRKSANLTTLLKLGYSKEDVVSFQLDALDLIVSDRIRRPRSGIPSRWKSTVVGSDRQPDDIQIVSRDEATMMLAEPVRPRSSQAKMNQEGTSSDRDAVGVGKNSAPRMSEGNPPRQTAKRKNESDPISSSRRSRERQIEKVGIEDTEKLRIPRSRGVEDRVTRSQRKKRANSPGRDHYLKDQKVSSAEVSRRSRTGGGRERRIYSGRTESKGRTRRVDDPPAPTMLWPDIDSFRSLLRTEAGLRLRILGDDFKDAVKDESDWRLNLYKEWLWTLHNGVGDPIVESRMDRMRRKASRRPEQGSAPPTRKRKRRRDDI